MREFRKYSLPAFTQSARTGLFDVLMSDLNLYGNLSSREKLFVVGLVVAKIKEAEANDKP